MDTSLRDRTVAANNDGTDETLFVYDESGNLIGEYDDTGTAILDHVWFNGAPVAVIDGTDEYYVHTDHLGTPRIITDGNTVIWRWESGPFGEDAAQEDPDGDSTDFTYNLRFPGQYYDSETGLHYNYFRDYDPLIGKYVQSDPAGPSGGINTYAYALNDPLGNVDRLGLSPTGDVSDCLLSSPFASLSACLNSVLPEFLSSTAKQIKDDAIACTSCFAVCTLEWVAYGGAEMLADEAVGELAERIARRAVRVGVQVTAKTLLFPVKIQNTYALVKCSLNCI